MKRIIIIATVFILSSIQGFAQIKVSGTVKDAKGEPVIGAVVMVVNTEKGSMTDVDGKYDIVVPNGINNPELKVSCIGYSEEIKPVGKGGVIDFVVRDEMEQLEEVVVVGYGSMRKSDLTGSVSSVRVDETTASHSNTIDQLLQGRAAGVQVLSNSGSPDAGVSIRVRGVSSFNGSTEPLYVIDGVIINSSGGGEALLTQGEDNVGGDEATNGLMGLNPRDIASIEILKDASATAIYGALGANGVILITTKGAERDKPVINFNAGVDVGKIAGWADVMSFDEYAQYLHYKVQNNLGVDATMYLKRMFSNPDEMTGLLVTPMNWQEQSLRTAVSQRYYLSISGRPETVSYKLSLGYNDKQGIVLNTGVKQYTARLNLSKDLSKKLKLNTKMNFAYVDSRLTQGTGGGRMTEATSMIRSMVTYRPFMYGLHDYDDLEDDEITSSSPFKWMNPIHFTNSRKEFRVTPNISLDYRILPWLKFNSTFGADYRNSERRKFKSSYINTTTQGSHGASGTYQYLNWNWDNTVNFDKKIKAHTISGTVGLSAFCSTGTTSTVSGWNIDQFKGGVESINAAPNAGLSYGEGKNTTLSAFARAVYNYSDRYVLTATWRLDGSSKFKGANKWANFPSFAFAWRINEEPWFKIDVVSAAKLRVGWGRVGNQSVGSYSTLLNYGNSRIASHEPGNESEAVVSLGPANIANENLKWETTEQLNLGLDVSLWKGRLAFTADLYDKTTYDLLQAKRIASSSGFSSIPVNEGNINNKGLELTLDAVPVKVGDFEWMVNGNISFNRNRIVKINEFADTKDIWVSLDKQQNVVYFEGEEIGSSSYLKQTANIFMEGYAMGLFYGYKVRGIVPEGSVGTPMTKGGEPRQPGQLDYYDLDGNGYIDKEDRTIIGDPNPDFTFGFGTTLSFKGFTLSANFNGAYGNKILNSNLAVMTDTYSSGRNILRDAYFKAWTAENQKTKYPAVGMIESLDFQKISDFYLEDGSYLRLASVSLNYDIQPKSWKVLKGIGVGVSGDNVFVWTKYSGWDPDVNSFGSNKMKMGVDSGSYPTCRTFSFDVKLIF